MDLPSYALVGEAWQKSYLLNRVQLHSEVIVILQLIIINREVRYINASSGHKAHVWWVDWVVAGCRSGP
ncbi:hypothetical protein J6590_053931 [Homalodisca vitripennis]|nr:hypothetical protein J6590_053931 [Homalodisca vitripennis]